MMRDEFNGHEIVSTAVNDLFEAAYSHGNYAESIECLKVLASLVTADEIKDDVDLAILQKIADIANPKKNKNIEAIRLNTEKLVNLWDSYSAIYNFMSQSTGKKANKVLNNLIRLADAIDQIAESELLPEKHLNFISEKLESYRGAIGAIPLIKARSDSNDIGAVFLGNFSSLYHTGWSPFIMNTKQTNLDGLFGRAKKREREEAGDSSDELESPASKKQRPGTD